MAGFAGASGRFLPLVCTLNCTRVTDWTGALLGVDRAGLEVLARSAPAAGGAVPVPHFDGERTPNRPDATGTLCGLRTSTTSAQIARAAFEGVICGLMDGLDALAAAGVATDGSAVLVGGGARSPLFAEVLADLSLRPVEVPDASTEWVALGAAVQASAVATGQPVEAVARRWSEVRRAKPAGVTSRRPSTRPRLKRCGRPTGRRGAEPRPGQAPTTSATVPKP